MPLYHTYRPTTFDEVVGNIEVVTALKADLAKENHPHAFLLHGPTGCGKTTLGRIIAKELDCAEDDFR
ncbi:MAG: AAA family ATPase, partial [Clostridia bacterium]|nr:AAA family ATPase [Clostridia bacterium]